MTQQPLDMDTKARLEMNAKGYKPDRDLDRVADLIEAGDRDALAKLPPRFVDLAQIQLDFRTYYRNAVAAGVIPDDRSANRK